MDQTADLLKAWPHSWTTNQSCFCWLVSNQLHITMWHLLSVIGPPRIRCHVALKCSSLPLFLLETGLIHCKSKFKFKWMMSCTHQATKHLMLVCKRLQVSLQFWCPLLFSGALSGKIATWFIFRSNILIILHYSAKKGNIATLFLFMLQQSGRVGNTCYKNSIRPLFFKHASPQL